MGRHTKANKRKRKNSSDGTSGQLKNARNGGSPVNVSVSYSIHNANSVLYGENSESEISVLDLDNSVFGTLEGSIMSNSEKTICCWYYGGQWPCSLALKFGHLKIFEADGL